MIVDFDIPRGLMLAVDAAEIVFDPAPHPYELAHASAIEANWQAEIAANPAYFDGKVMLFSTIRWHERRIEGRCHAIRFATYLHWRRHRADASAEHLYAHAMPVSSDGALVAIRMSPGTANAGRVYFAAGSFDMSDVKDGHLDIDFNMEREVMEETGIELSGTRRDPGFHGFSANNGTVIVRRYFLDETADALAVRIRAFIASDPDPEISEPVIIRSAGDLPEGLMPHMPPLIEWHFGAAGNGL